VTDPLRLSDDADPELARLLRAGQEERPPGHALEKTIAGVGAATTVIGASHAAAAAAVGAGKIGIWTLAKWAGAGVLSGVITVGGVEVAQRAIQSNQDQNVTASEALPAPKPAARASDTTPPVKAFPAAPPSPASESAALPSEPQQFTRQRGPSATGQPEAARAVPAAAPAGEIDSAISIEIGLIDEARRALRAGRASAALEVLNRYRTAVTRPRLAPEAQYLEMEALFAAGNGAAAQRAAALLLERSSKGPHAARARAILGPK